MKKRHIILLLLLIGRFSFAQHYTNYTTKDGLPSNHVYRITQDNQGFIWFITDKGMVKYNGTAFKTFTTKEGLPTNDIWNIRITPNHKIWYFTKASKLGYIKNDTVFSFESTVKNKVMYPQVIYQNGNEIFFSIGNTSFQLKNNKWHFSSQDSSVPSELLSHKTIKKYNYYKDSLVVFDKKNVKIKTFKLPKELRNANYRLQINDSLFCWVDEKGYTLLNLNTLKTNSHKFQKNGKQFESKFVRVNTANNQIQFSGLNFVGFLNKKTELENVTTIPENFNSHYSFIDKDENLWIATFNNGVYFLPKTKRNSLNLLENEKVNRLQIVDNKLIASVYNKGFYKYDVANKKFNPFIKEKDFIFEAVKIDTLNTEFYITNRNTYKIKNKIKTKYNYTFIDVSIRNLIYYNGFLYGKTSFGLHKMDSEDLSVKNEYKQFGIRNIINFENQLIIATSNGLKIFKDDKITPLKLETDILNKPILNIVKTKDQTIIVCTDGFGAYITDLKNTYLLEQSDYLSVQSAFVKNNEIWLATNKGVLQYRKTENSYNLTKTYTANDGLSTNITNSVVIFDANLMVSSNDGVSIIPINQPKLNVYPTVYFDKIQYNNTFLSQNVTFDYVESTSLNLTISAIDFSEDNTLNYEYQLLPIQQKWIKTSSKQISFYDLQPEEYTLNIKPILASNFEVSEVKTATLDFTIKPLWWQRLVFKITAGLMAFLLFLYLVLSINKRQKKKKEEKLMQEKQLLEIELKALRSQINPHFVFNSLAAIQYYINDNDFETSEKYLLKFSTLIRQFFELSKEAKISLSKEINLLKNYLDLEILRFKTKLNYTINVDAQLDTKKVEIPTTLLQPIVENAVNHGIFNKLENGHITINFLYIDTQTFKVEIIDDGVGFINTRKPKIGKVKSTNVLKDRLHFLNQSKNWKIKYHTEELHPELEDKGNKATFIISSVR